MLLLSHRGYHVDAPENTLDAFQHAIDLGVDGIETDVRMTADGVAVLFHDRVVRTGRPVVSLTHAELCEATGLPVPTLESALRLQSAREFIWNIEVKTSRATDAVVALAEFFRTSRRLLVTSFAHGVVAEIAGRVAVECGALVAHRPAEFVGRPAWLPDSERVNAIVWNFETIDEELLRESQKCGLNNFAYGLVTPEEHARARGWNIDGIITDRPEFVLASRA